MISGFELIIIIMLWHIIFICLFRVSCKTGFSSMLIAYTTMKKWKYPYVRTARKKTSKTEEKKKNAEHILPITCKIRKRRTTIGAKKTWKRKYDLIASHYFNGYIIIIVLCAGINILTLWMFDEEQRANEQWKKAVQNAENKFSQTAKSHKWL